MYELNKLKFIKAWARNLARVLARFSNSAIRPGYYSFKYLNFNAMTAKLMHMA